MDFELILANDPKDFAAKVRAWLHDNHIMQDEFNYSFDVLETKGGQVWFIMTIFYVPLQPL